MPKKISIVAGKPASRFVDWNETDLDANAIKNDAQVSDINTRLEHLSKRVDDNEALLKRLVDHYSQFHRI